MKQKLHRLSLKKNGLSVRNIGFSKYFLTTICCVASLIFSLFILSIGDVSQ